MIVIPSDDELKCALEEEGGCWGTARDTIWCEKRGHKILGHLCAVHAEKMHKAEKDLSCGRCAEEGRRGRVVVAYDHELDTWWHEEPVWTAPVSLYPWRFATTDDAVWWGHQDGRADHARFPGGLTSEEEISAFLGLLHEDPDLEEPRRSELAGTYRNAWRQAFDWVDAALPGTIGYPCECGCDGRYHVAVWTTDRPLYRRECTKCRCRKYRPDERPKRPAGRKAQGDPAAGRITGELAGDAPYQAAIAALGAYGLVADAQRRATEALEASLTVHGFDRDPALMEHISALRDATGRLETDVRAARAGLTADHALGDEYHSSGRDAASSALRPDGA